jgi:hypothetical protein
VGDNLGAQLSVEAAPTGELRANSSLGAAAKRAQSTPGDA